MNLTKIAIAGCVVLSFAQFAAADEVRIDTEHRDTVVRDNPHPHPVVRHDDDWYWRHHRHHHEHHDDGPRLDVHIDR